MNEEYTRFVIRGVTQDGQRFRPSDWAERLCGALARVGSDGRIRRSPHVRIQLDGNEKRLVVDTRLASENRAGFEFVQGFARDNGLPTETLPAVA